MASFSDLAGRVRRVREQLAAGAALRRLPRFSLLLLPAGLLAAAGGGLLLAPPITAVEPGEAVLRVNQLTGGVTELHEGFALALPGIHHLRRYPLRDLVFRTGAGTERFQTSEGLTVSVEVTIRYALDPTRIAEAARGLPEDVIHDLVEPTITGVLHRTLSRHTAREIFTTRRAAIEDELVSALTPVLRGDGVRLKALFLGAVGLPDEYRAGLEQLLSEELATEKLRFVLQQKEKQVTQSRLEAESDKVRRETAAEAAGQEEVIAARARAEAMRHVLPFKEKEIEQRRLEAEAGKVARITEAEAEAAAGRIGAAAEADRRRTLADADAYRTEVTGKAASAQLERDAEVITRSPLLIQKTIADKLSDKIQVIIAPPEAGFFAAGLVGGAGTQGPARMAGARASGRLASADRSDRNDRNDQDDQNDRDDRDDRDAGPDGAAP